MDQLTERQTREIEYHRKRAESHDSLLSAPSDDVVFSPERRWWNQYWEMYTYLLGQNLKDKKVLIVGCGFGEDSLGLAKMGAQVFAFDLSPESVALARQLAAREGLEIQFAEMPAERLEYESNFFDCVIARDILHHTDIPLVLTEIARVSKKKAVLVINEVYSHSVIDRIRRFRVVDRWLYPLLRDFVYEGRDPYITDDERKLTEADVCAIAHRFAYLEIEKYFGLIVGRILPDKYSPASKIDRLLLIALGPIARLFGSRVISAGAWLLVPAGDARRLAAALGRLVRRPEMRQRFDTAGRRRAEQQCRADCTAREDVRVYRRLAGGTQPASADISGSSRCPETL